MHLRQPRDGYRVGTDAVMLAASINTGVVSKKKPVDMQSSANACWIWGQALAALPGGLSAVRNVHVTAVERDQASFDLLCHNISVNDQTEVIRPYLGNVLALPPVLRGSFDHVFANPPFHHGSDMPSGSRRRREAHFADEAALSDWVASALWAVKSKGRVSFIVRADRTDQVIRGLSDGGAGGFIVPFMVLSQQLLRMIITACRRKGGDAMLPGCFASSQRGFDARSPPSYEGGGVAVAPSCNNTPNLE